MQSDPGFLGHIQQMCFRWPLGAVLADPANAPSFAGRPVVQVPADPSLGRRFWPTFATTRCARGHTGSERRPISAMAIHMAAGGGYVFLFLFVFMCIFFSTG